MSMFRKPVISSKNVQYFGVGSILIADKKYLLAGVVSGNGIALINLDNMFIMPGWVEVEDVNQISESEAREICELTNLNWTLSDFDFDAKGIK